MHIITPAEIERVAWDGYLEPLGQTFKSAALRPRVTLGEPVWWPAAQAMENETGKEWVPPVSDRRYTLLRLACTLHPLADPHARYDAATLTLYLRPRRNSAAGPVVAHDIYPRRLSAERQTKFDVGLGPDLKFAQLFEASLFGIGAEIEYRQVFPVIQGYGLGESRPYWQFVHHESNPLLGSQSVYAVLDAPPDSGGVRLSVELVATLQTRFGPLRVGLPEEARAHLSRVIEKA